VLILFSLTIFISAFLLFLIQPMFARMILPTLGGAPAIWNTALVFYQAALLGGYAYAHASARWLGVRSQSLLHLGLMLVTIAFLPIAPPADWTPPSASNPLPWLLALLTLSVGLPFFVVSATSPLLQRWFAEAQHRQSPDPYFLYAASNLGSMLALLAYPLAVEPTLRSRQQGGWWAFGYAVLVVMMGTCVAFTWRSAHREGDQSVHNRTAGALLRSAGNEDDSLRLLPGATRAAGMLTAHPRVRWVVLAFVPSSLMISVTTYLTTDIASVPLLWVIPLWIYLLTFAMAFAAHPLMRHVWMVRAAPFVLLPLVILLTIQAADPIALVIPLHLAAFFVVAMVCHGELARSRPPVRDLTRFYLYLSVGGVLGGAFNVLLAPLLFDGIAEYPIALTLACLLLPSSSPDGWRSWPRFSDLVLPALLGLAAVLLISRVQGVNPNPGLPAAAIAFGLPALLSLSFLRHRWRFALSVGAIFVASALYSGSQGRTLYAERSFFGVTKVSRDHSGQFNQILQGTTLHGSQWVNSALHRKPLAYYHPDGPLGQVFDAFNASGRGRNVAVVGLGAGSVCCYAREGQRWTYYEIDPVVERIATDPRFFTYLKDCRADVRTVLGDGRLSLAADTGAQYDLLIIDAYSSDSVPVHLLTREALQLYLKRLALGGILAFHVSNRYLDIEPVLANLARDAGLCAMTRTDGMVGGRGAELGKTGSRYLIVARTSADLARIAADSRWVPSRTRDDVGVWTDDYSSILKIVKWRR
jgi:hypothetical protein